MGKSADDASTWEAEMEKTIELFAGIDVAKHKVDVYLHPTSERFVLRTDTEAGYGGLVALLKERRPKRVVFESTGGYGRRLAEALEAGGVQAHCVPAQRVRKFAESIGLKAKTDAIDAEAIGRYAAVAALVDKAELSPAVRDLRELVVRRMQLVRLSAKEKNHRETMTDALVASWSELQRALDKHIDDLDNVLVAAVNADDDLRKRAAVLSTIKGCGMATCAALLALMPELGTISNKQAASLVGVAPFNNESADTNKPRSIYGGRRRLRSILYMGTLTAALYDEKISATYQRLLANNKPKKVALTAAARKFIVIANARMRDAFPNTSDTAGASDDAAVNWKPWRRKRKRASKTTSG